MNDVAWVSEAFYIVAFTAAECNVIRPAAVFGNVHIVTSSYLLSDKNIIKRAVTALRPPVLPPSKNLQYRRTRRL